MQMEDPSGDCTSNNLDHNYSRKCLLPHSENLTYPEQTATGKYFQQYSCRILQPTSYKIVTGSSPFSDDLKPAQENHLNSKCTLPTGEQKTNIVLWTPPGSRVQVFVPVNNMQETNIVPNISNCVSRPGTEVFNSNNSVCMQQQSTSVPADANSLQQFQTKTIENKNLNDMQRDLTHANATNDLPQQDPSTKRMTLRYNYRNNPTTTNAPNGQNSPLCGPVYHGVRAEYSSDHAHLQTPSACKQNVKQNNATKKAVAVVTPLSPVEIASVNFSINSAHALDVRSAPIHHLPNFTHPLKINADPQTMREPNEPACKHQRPKSAEPKLVRDMVKSPVCLLESTSQCNQASSPKLNCPVTDQNKPSEIQKEASEKIPKDKQAVTDKKTNTGETDKNSTIPVIEWPLDKLHTLLNIIQQIEDVHQKNINKMDSGKEILRLFWNGDVSKFRNAVKSRIYENVMEDVYNYCQGKDDVILAQIKSDTRNQVAKDFLVLKHDEMPPKIEYKSSWLNLDENLDEIDRECGISWYFRHLHSFSKEQEKGNSVGKLQHRLLDAPDKPSKRQCSTETNCQNLFPEDVQTFPKSKDKTMDNEGLNEHFSSKKQFLPSQNTAGQTHIPNDSLISIENVSMAETSSVISAGGDCLEEDLQKVNAPQEMTLSNSNPPQELETIPRDEKISLERFEEKTNNAVHTIQDPLTDASHKSPITGHDLFAMEISSKTLAEVQTSSVHENSSDSIIKSSHADTNRHVPMLDDVVTEETSYQPSAKNPLMAITNLVKTLDNQAVAKSRSSAVTSGRGQLYGGRAVQSNEWTRKSNCAGSPNVKANESQVKNSAHATQTAFREGTGHRDAKAVNKVRVEKQIQLQFENKNSDYQSGGLLTETGDGEDNRLLKPESMVTGQTNCQPNNVNSLEGLANVFRTLEKSDISLRIYENQIGKQEVLKRSGSGGTRPILTDLLMNRGLPTLSPTVAKQRAQIHNGSDEKPTNSDCVDKMIDEPSITERDDFAMEIGNEVPAEPQIPPENLKLCKNLHGFVGEQSLTETNSNHSMKPKHVETKQSSHQPHIVNPLAAMTEIICSIDKRVAVGKPGMSKTNHQLSAKMSRWDVRSGFTKPDNQSGCTNSKPNPVVEEQQKAVQSPRMQNECYEKTDTIIVRSHKVAKLCFSSEMTEGEDLQIVMAGESEIMHSSSQVNSEQCDNTDTQCDSLSSSRSFHAIPERLQEEDFMGSFEEEPKNSTNAGQNASLKLYKPTEDLLEGMHHSAVSETSGLVGGVCNGTDDESTIENNFTSPPKLDPVEFVPSPQMQDESSEMIPNDACALAEAHVTEVALHGKEEVEVDAFASIKINVLPHGIAELWFAGKMTEDKDLQKNIDVQTSSKDQVDVNILDYGDDQVEIEIPDHSDDQVDVKILDNSDDQVEIEILDHSDDQVDVKILDNSDDQVEIEIPDHSDDQVDVKILDNSDDQVEIEILDHSDDQIKVIFPEKHAEDIKPIERNNLGEVDEKLESYCCIAKWFQALNYGDGSFCMCQVKTELSEQKLEIRASDTSVKMDTKEDRFGVISKEHGCIDLKVDLLTTDEKSSESTKALLTLDAGTPNDAAVDNTRTVKACPVSEVISETSEQINDDSPSKCATDKIPMRSEKTKPSPDVKKSSETVCLSLYGSSNRRDRLIRNKRYKNGGEKPPEDLEITISSHQKNDRRMLSKRKWDELVETEDVSNVRKKNVRVSPKSSPQGHKATTIKVSEVTNENALSSSALTRKRFNPPHNSKRLSKKKQSLGTRQISMNNYVIRRKTMSPKSFHPPEPVLKSKYELRNPALMPLQEGFGLEFKVLPSSFNFKDGTDLANIQADALSRAKNGIPYTEDKKAEGRKTIHAPVQGKWSLSPLKSKQIQSADVSSSCSLFREFKKRYQDKKKEIVSRQNLNSN